MSKVKIYVVSVLFAGLVAAITGAVFYTGYSLFMKLLEYVSFDAMWFGAGSVAVIAAFYSALRWSIRYNEKKETK